jgi:hypothetical protein
LTLRQLAQLCRNFVRQRMLVMIHWAEFALDAVLDEGLVVLGADALFQIYPAGAEWSTTVSPLRDRLCTQPAAALLQLCHKLPALLDYSHELVAQVIRMHSFGRFPESLFTVPAGRD